MKKLSPLFFALALANPVLAEDYSNEILERPATDTEMSYCDHSKDLTGQMVFLGDSGVAERHVEILICSGHDVWQLSCEMAEAMAGIFASVTQKPNRKTTQIEQNMTREVQEAANSCNGLFLS